MSTKVKGTHFCNLEGLTFQQLITDTINRELSEENGFYSESIAPIADKVKTKVIGLARLLDRGGKPDFFGITYIDVKAEELYPQMNVSLGKVIHVLHPNEYTDQEISCHILIPFQRNIDITTSVRDAIEKVLKPSNQYNSSFQTGMLLDLIDTYYRDGIDLFGELQKKRAATLLGSLCEPADGEDGFGFSSEGGFAFVIDGATSLGGAGSFTAQEFTEELKTELNKRLANTNIDIQTILLKSISAIKRKNPAVRSAVKGFSEAGERHGPSAAITIIRLKDDKIEYYSLGDCSLSVKYKDGSVKLYTNSELIKLDNNLLNYIQQLATEDNVGGVRKAASLPAIATEKLVNRNLKNQKGGYQILDLSRVVIPNGKYRTFNATIIESLVLMTDGIADLYKMDRFNPGHSYTSDNDIKQIQVRIHELLIKDPLSAVATLKEEYKADPEWDKYPRFKEIDDITILGLSIS